MAEQPAHTLTTPQDRVAQSQETHILMPCAGKFDRHIDLWDALKNNKYLSWEGVKHVGSQMGSLIRTPDLPGPPYTILRKTKQYEIRRCLPLRNSRIFLCC